MRRHHHGSAYGRGMFGIVAPSNTALEDGGDYLMQWNEISPPSITGVRLIRDRWFVGPAGSGHSLAHHNYVANGSFPIRMVMAHTRPKTCSRSALGPRDGLSGA